MPGASDWRALSLLETEQPTLPEIMGGIGFTLAAFVLTPSLALTNTARVWPAVAVRDRWATSTVGGV